jgi:biopolymer transport protein ExbD
MGARLSVSGKIGLALILIVLCPIAGWKYWMMTRTWVPLYTPMSLAPGHFRTGEFKINLQATYLVYVQVDRKEDYQGTSCLLGIENCKDKPDVVKVAWTLLDDGRVMAQGQSSADHGKIGWGEFVGRNLGNFYVNGGRHYVLQVDVLADGSRLKSADPHLVVENASNYSPYGEYWQDEAYGDYAFWPILLILPVGMTLLLRSISDLLAERRERQRVPLTEQGRSNGAVLIAEESSSEYAARTATQSADSAPSSLNITGAASVGQNFQWARKQPLRRPFSGLPQFGIIGGVFFVFLVFMFGILGPRTSTGLKVRLLAPGAAPVESDAWTEPLVVQLRDAGPGREPRLYVNSKEIAWRDLDRTLKQELGRRKDWVVYVGGDAALPWADITDVVDVARGDHAKVFLVTQFGVK